MFQGGFSEGCWEREWCEGRFSGLALPRGKERAAAPLRGKRQAEVRVQHTPGNPSRSSAGNAASLIGLSPWARKSWPSYSHLIRWVLSPGLANKNPRCPIKFQIKNEYFKNMSISPVLLGTYLRLKKKLSIVYLKVKFNGVSCILAADLDVGMWEGCGLGGGGSAEPALKGLLIAHLASGGNPPRWGSGYCLSLDISVSTELQSWAWAGSPQRTTSINCH